MGAPENRRFTRIPSDLIAQIRTSAVQRAGQDLVVKDISRGGSFIETEAAFKPGDLIEVIFRRPNSTQTFAIKAVVRWRSEFPPRGIGLKFIRAKLSNKHQLKQYIDDHLSPPRPTDPSADEQARAERSPPGTKGMQKETPIFFVGFEGESMKKVSGKAGDTQLYRREKGGEFMPIIDDAEQKQITAELLKLIADGNIEALEKMDYKIKRRRRD